MAQVGHCEEMVTRASVQVTVPCPSISFVNDQAEWIRRIMMIEGDLPADTSVTENVPRHLFVDSNLGPVSVTWQKPDEDHVTLTFNCGMNTAAAAIAVRAHLFQWSMVGLIDALHGVAVPTFLDCDVIFSADKATELALMTVAVTKHPTEQVHRVDVSRQAKLVQSRQFPRSMLVLNVCSIERARQIHRDITSANAS